MRRSADPAPAGDAPPLDPGIATYVDLCRAPSGSTDLEAMRLEGDLSAHRFAGNFSVEVTRFDTFIAAPGREIAVRVYDPGGTGARPGMVYFHGGGFAFGSIESFDIVGAGLAAETGAVVVSVQYRRLPDVKYPAAQDDCDLAFAWCVRQAEILGIDPDYLGVAGDSAGALLALACAANARDAGATMPRFQVLLYGAFAMDPDRPDYTESRDPLLVTDRIRGYIDLFRRCGGLDRRAAPIDRKDLAGLPPTHLVAAELDPLRGEAIVMAERLDGAGVPVTLRHAPGMIHGFLRAIGVSGAARQELAHAAAAMRPFSEG